MSKYDQFSSEELLQVIEEYGRAEAEKERERIIEVIRDWYEADADLIDGPGNLIDWIENGGDE